MVRLSWFEDYGEDDYQGFNMNSLRMDQAYLTPIIKSATELYIYKKHKECTKCSFQLLTEFAPMKDHQHIALSNVPNNLYRISTEKMNLLPRTQDYMCEFGSEMGEFGIYQLNFTEKECGVVEIKEPVSIAFPALTVFFIYLALFLCVFGVIQFRKYFLTTLKVVEPKQESTGKKRVRSLDTFRGISIVIMIFVNYGAGSYEILDHSIWNGLHMADLVFPWFMWIMGAVIPISLSASFKRNTSNKDILVNVLKRSIKLFILGIFLTSGSGLNCLRIFGVLQRFGVAYLVVTTICVLLMERKEPNTKNWFDKNLGDVMRVLKGWCAILIILIIYCCIFFLVADEGCPKGYMGPGGLDDDGKHRDCTGGATGYVDKIILGNHRFQNPTIREVFLTEGFDPEGLLGCLTSIVHVFFGVQAGMILLVHKNHSARILRWLLWSVATGAIGGALCGFSKEDGFIPVNKNVWSISFVMVTCCFAFLLLAVCYVLIDVVHWWSGKPFLFAGMNSTLMYIGHEMTYGHFPVRWTLSCDKDHGTHFIALFENLWGTGFWVLVAYYLYRIKHFYTL